MKINTAKITRIALATALVTIGAQLAIPTIPPVTLQTVAIFIMSVLLSVQEAVIMSILYILLGIIGLPVFSSFAGGIGVILSVGGGFIISFPFIAFTVSFLHKKLAHTSLIYAIIFSFATLIAYIFGALWIKIMGYYEGEFTKALTSFVLPFIPFDAIKIFICVICTKKLRSIFGNEKNKLQNNKSGRN